ncbi:hypothetical protein [Lacipirellula sp.]|uniref:hypothetical protein n=1 Tax=Lacipirellula sp. TaxID=2691419 RepID=UPI003D0C201A
MTKPRFNLLIEANHQADDPDGTRRLRLVLKRLLRSFGLRCVTAVPVNVASELEQVAARDRQNDRTVSF